MYRIAFRVDGGPDIGLGHLMRCISFALELIKKNCKIFFISNNKEEILICNNFEIIEISNEKFKCNKKDEFDLRQEIEALKKILNAYKIDCLIIDHYGVSFEYLSFLKRIIKKLVYIDDLCVNSLPVDILINGNIYAEDGCYNNFSKDIKYLLGNRYTLLRKEFINRPKRYIKKVVKNILITTGGSDNHNLIIRFLKLIKENENTKNLNCKVIIGKYFKNQKEIELFAQKFSKIELIMNMNNIADLMLESDLVLSTSGTTLYELAITGTPSISFIIAENQEKLAKKMNKLSCTINLGWFNQVDDEIIFENILKLMNNYHLRKSMSKLGQKLFDGKGPQRCAKEILKLMKQLN